MKKDKQIEKLVEKLMMESALERPSVDFTRNVMSRVLIAEKSKILVYKPVISKRAWFTIFAGIIALFAFLIFNSAHPTFGTNVNLPYFNFNEFFKTFAHITISTMTTNVLLAAALMLFIQIFLLKNYLNKKFEK